MRRRVLVTTVLASVLGLAACSGSTSTPTPIPPAPTGTPAPATAAVPTARSSVSPTDAGSPLPGGSGVPVASAGASQMPFGEAEGSEWVLVKHDEAGTMMDVDPSLRATLTLIDGLASGSTGCNTFRGPYTLEGQSLVFGPLVLTQDACDEAAMALETSYLTNLARVGRLGSRGGGLALLSPSGAPILAYVSAPTGTLVGDWAVVAYLDADGAIVAPLEGFPMAASFMEDGSLSGNDGCNSFQGTYTVEGARIAMGSLSGGPRSPCPTEELTAQEDAFLAAFQDVAIWSASASVLELRGPDAILRVGFARRPGP